MKPKDGLPLLDTLSDEHGTIEDLGICPLGFHELHIPKDEIDFLIAETVK